MGGPPLVKAATGEIVDAETLGGGKVHTEISGVCDYLAKDEFESFHLTRELFGSIDEKFDFKHKNQFLKENGKNL